MAKGDNFPNPKMPQVMPGMGGNKLMNSFPPMANAADNIPVTPGRQIMPSSPPVVPQMVGSSMPNNSNNPAMGMMGNNQAGAANMGPLNIPGLDINALMALLNQQRAAQQLNSMAGNPNMENPDMPKYAAQRREMPRPRIQGGILNRRTNV